MGLYTITDWLGLVPIAVCIGFGLLGLVQWVRRKRIAKVDTDILLLGGYYILVILGYLIFEMIPINYRPILIDGAMEASYPSSTTLLVLSVMPTLLFQVNRRTKRQTVRRMTAAFVVLFSAFMVVGRLVAGVHWLTDIVGGLLLSGGLLFLYWAASGIE
jgi:undecaprenyl-diphosphatase